MHCALVLSLTALASSAAAPTPPFWGPTWTAPFNQSITIYTLQWNNSVEFLYDSTTKLVGSSLYRHSKGQHDEMCTSIKGKEMSDEECVLLASNDTWRYVYFPEDPAMPCCKYCNTTQFCGIVRPDWLQENSTYQGQLNISGMLCDGWMKEGGEQNYWYAEVTTQQPCEYYEGYPTLPDTSNYWRFIPSRFSRAAIPYASFVVPEKCTAMCATSSSTYQERLEARFAAGVGGNLVRVAAAE